MDETTLSRFPHYTWLGVTFTAGGDGSWNYVPFRAVAHVVSVVLDGRRQVRLIGPQLDTEWTETTGTVHFLPADGRRYTLVTQSAAPCRAHMLLIPRRHLIADGEPPAAAAGLARLVRHDDAALRASTTRLAALPALPALPVAPDATAATAAAVGGPPTAADEAARAVIRRLRHLNGCGDPDWHDDASVFDRRTLERLVGRIDGRLPDPPGSDDLALVCGLSPNHFARKFRRSTGSSLHRFVNRRRLQAALATLPHPDVPLARLAVDLGFASQSHFTRLFGETTGMTPARCRSHFGARHC